MADMINKKFDIKNKNIVCARDADLCWFVGTSFALLAIWRELKPEAIPLATKILYDVRHLLPHLGKNQSDKFLPQELNLDRGAGLSFEKGCYPGQEIIARVKYRGTVKRTLKKLKSKNICDLPPKAEDNIVNWEGKKIGSILKVARSSDNISEILAVLDTSTHSTIFDEKLKCEFEISDID